MMRVKDLMQEMRIGEATPKVDAKDFDKLLPVDASDMHKLLIKVMKDIDDATDTLVRSEEAIARMRQDNIGGKREDHDMRGVSSYYAYEILNRLVLQVKKGRVAAVESLNGIERATRRLAKVKS